MTNILKITSSLFILALIACSSNEKYRYVNTSRSNPQPTINTPVTPPRNVRPQPTYPRYIVERGDTLASISRRSGISVDNIVRFNQLKSHIIEVGQILYLPGVYNLKPDAAPSVTQKNPVDNNQVQAPAVDAAPKVSIIPRTRWATSEIKGNITPMGEVKKITIHHTDEMNALGKMTDIEFIRAMENHHRNTRKWACIAYHYIIGRDGKIYEGRPMKYQGAHASSNNPNNLGISLIGNFSNKSPSPSQIKALETLLAQLRVKYKVDATSVYGHTHLGHTECPGKVLKKWIEIYRTKK